MGLIMLKKIKILSIFTLALVLLLFLNTAVLSTDINMNLPSEDTNTVSEDNVNTINNIQDTGNAVDNTSSNTIATQDDIGGDATPSSVSSIAQENMSFSNILNILIITVGVILILLAIAILIRLKS